MSWSACVREAERAADDLAGHGIAAEVIDLRTLWPWDRETVLGSVAKTGRLLVAHEAVGVGGFGAEIAATVAEHVGVPVARVAAPRAPIAYAPTMESVVKVTGERIAARARQMVEAAR